jgi:hypothetical protein
LHVSDIMSEVNGLQPKPPVEVSRVMVDEVMERMRRGEPILFIDARSDSSWQKSDVTIPGSVRVPPDEAGKHLGSIPRGRSVVTFCT